MKYLLTFLLISLSSAISKAAENTSGAFSFTPSEETQYLSNATFCMLKSSRGGGDLEIDAAVSTSSEVFSFNKGLNKNPTASQSSDFIPLLQFGTHGNHLSIYPSQLIYPLYGFSSMSGQEQILVYSILFFSFVLNVYLILKIITLRNQIPRRFR